MRTILIFLVTISVLYSQKVEDIITDRPDQTESASIVPKGLLQLEVGAAAEEDEPVVGVSKRTFSAPGFLIRYGISKNVELRLGSEYINDKSEFIDGFSIKNSGMAPISLGTKIKMFSENGVVPQTAFIFHIVIPYEDGNVFHSEHIGTDFRFAMAHGLSERFTLSYNLGGEWDGEVPNATGIYTLSIGISLIKNLSMYVESYGFVTQEEMPDHRLDGGLTYLFSKNIQTDISGGIGISDRSPDYFIGAGFSIRLPR